jgi:hypothetical protein
VKWKKHPLVLMSGKNKLKKMTQHAHPNIYTVIQLFKDIQNSIEIAIESSWWYHLGGRVVSSS